jgi:hypothetical protein
MRRDTVSLFLDTNIFLHYRSIKEIDWLEVANARSVEIVVCLTVIKELDNKKWDARLASRAQRAINDIRHSESNENVLRKGVSLSISQDLISDKDFPDTLDLRSSDDQILHLVLKYGNKHTDRTVAIVTGDFGMVLRAKSHRVEAIELDKKFVLEQSTDETTKELAKAREKLRKLEDRHPKLEVSLSPPGAGYTGSSNLEWDKRSSSVTIDVDREMEIIRRAHPKLEARQTTERMPKGAIDILRIAETRGVDEEARLTHNKQLKSFYDEYRHYLERLRQHQDLIGRLFSFELWLSNKGTGPATTLDVHVTCDAKALVLDGKDEAFQRLTIPPSKPEPPTLRHPFEELYGYRNLTHIPDMRLDLRSAIQNIDIQRDPRTPIVMPRTPPTSEMDIRLEILKHGDTIRLGSFHLLFQSYSDLKSISAFIMCSCVELPEKFEKSLHFRFPAIDS